MLCDGRMVCGCADPYGKRVLGDARTATVAGIWTGDTASRLRQDLNGGGSKFCGDCPLKLPLKRDQAPPQRDLNVGPLPSRLYVECTAACNISCNQACCAPETGITRTRQAGMLDFDLFTRVLDEAGPSLGRVDFFNYGEAFLHKRAVEMCEYIKAKFPHIYLYTSTNGLALTEERARRLVHSGIDEVTFSIDGATPETYVQYRQRGDFNKAIANLTAAVDEKSEERARRSVHQLALHPVQVERQRRGDGARAQAGHRDRRGPPLAGRSPIIPRTRTRAASCPARRRSRHQIRDVGRQRPRERDPRRDAACRHRRRTLIPGLPLVARAGPAAAGPHARAEPLRRAPSRRRPATDAVSCASARSSAPPTAPSSSATTRGPGCPTTSRPGRGRRRIEIPAPEAPGRYSAEVRPGE